MTRLAAEALLRNSVPKRSSFPCVRRDCCVQKAQVAVDNGIPVNFQKLDYFDRPEFVEMFKKEDVLLKKARQEVLSAPKGQYTIPSYVADYTPIEVRLSSLHAGPQWPRSAHSSPTLHVLESTQIAE